MAEHRPGVREDPRVHDALSVKPWLVGSVYGGQHLVHDYGFDASSRAARTASRGRWVPQYRATPRVPTAERDLPRCRHDR